MRFALLALVLFASSALAHDAGGTRHSARVAKSSGRHAKAKHAKVRHAKAKHAKVKHASHRQRRHHQQKARHGQAPRAVGPTV